MTVALTYSQRMAQAAYRCLEERHHDPDFCSFARSFPSLIHACGLAQSIAFAGAKKKGQYLDHLAQVLRAAGVPNISTTAEFEAMTRNTEVLPYVRLSRAALQAASWLKRYAEAMSEVAS